MKEQLEETFGVMVYQEDVLKVVITLPDSISQMLILSGGQ